VILTITPNPCVDKTLFIDALRPGEKIRAPRYGCIAGGKGCNVSRAIKAMGGDTVAMPFVGGHTGRHVVDMLEQQDGLRCATVWVKDMTRTITTVLEEPIHRQTALFEPGSRVTSEECRKALELVEQLLPEADLITMNGSAPDATLDNFYHDVVMLAHKAGVKTIVDAYGAIFERALEALPYMVKPNAEEAQQLLQRAITNRAEQWAAVDWFHDKGIPLVVLSLGADGALVSFRDCPSIRDCPWEDAQFHAHPPAIEEVNPVGSGDALVAGFALGITQDMDIESTARRAVAMGTANAMSWDIGTFTKTEVDVLLPKIQILAK